MGQRLNWDQDTRKETSDIYIKPRMIAIAVTFVPFIYFLFLRYKYQMAVWQIDVETKLPRVRIFLRGFCLKNGSHACIGGR